MGRQPLCDRKEPLSRRLSCVVESVSKLIAAGASYEDVYLSFQEYFLKPGHDPKRWGQPLSALLGAFKAQLDLGVAAIGGKDSMSGTFEHIDVPPTLVSFAVTTGKVGEVVSPVFKAAGHKVVLLVPEYENGLPVPCFPPQKLHAHALSQSRSSQSCSVRARRSLPIRPASAALRRQCSKWRSANRIGFRFAKSELRTLFGYHYGAFVLELAGEEDVGILLGETVKEEAISMGGETLSLEELQDIYENKLESVYACNIQSGGTAETFTCEERSHLAPAVKTASPKVLIPVFPGTNCEYDTAKAFADAGQRPRSSSSATTRQRKSRAPSKRLLPASRTPTSSLSRAASRAATSRTVRASSSRPSSATRK